jgi:CheY-like chemotaxis protein
MFNSQPISVVIADDDQDDHFLVKQALCELGIDHQVTSVYSGYQLLELLGNIDNDVKLPDVILLDINMPRLDGFSVLQRVAADELQEKVPVFILSTSRTETDRNRSKQLGAKGFYTKPFFYEELKQIIANIHSKVVPVVAMA